MSKIMKYKILPFLMAKNITVPEVAKKCRVSRQTVYRWLSIKISDEASIKSDDLKNLADMLDVSMEDLYMPQPECYV